MSSTSPTVFPETQTEDDSPRLHKRRRTDSSTSSLLGNSSKPATRRKTACQTCRLRKVKCDGARPVCGLCRTTDTSCEYIDPLPQKLTLDSATQLLCSKLDQLQRTLDLAQPRSKAPHSSTTCNGNEPRTSAVDGLPGEALHRHDSTASTTAHESVPSPGDERMKDYLKIPAHRTTADAVLAWDVFGGRWPSMALIGVHFQSTDQEGIQTAVDSMSSAGVSGADLLLPKEEQIPSLVDKFLENVHTKNPVLDVEQLVKHSRRIAANGLTWDGWSCLVLLASALGTIAKPFSAWMTFPASPLHGRESSWTPDIPATAEELQRAESYFVLACRRIGCLRYSVLGAQCHFFAGVYLMYTLRPLLSWQYFIAASNLYQVHMKTTYGLAADFTGCDHLPLPPNDSPHRKTQKRLEESMYWSCFKSESEFRVELPLPQSELSNYAHPSLFPSPPSPTAAEGEEDGDLSRIYSNGSAAETGRSFGKIRSREDEADELRRHAKLLCNEEESWYYYLTEIALRRIGNRIINAFFGDKSISWSNVQELLPIAVEYDTQVTAWSANLPLAMQHWEMSEAIRAPAYNPSLDGIGNPVSRELSWAIDNRLLEMRSWLYQPFLHYLIHMVPTPQTASAHPNKLPTVYPPTQDSFVTTMLQMDPNCTEENAALLHHFIASGMECNLKILDVRSLRHRHHGLWFDLRSTMCAGLVLLAVVKSGHSDWIPGGPDLLWGRETATASIAGKIGHVLDEFDFWTTESPDMRRHREVLEDATRFVRAALG